ncbi:unnamed protein product [Rhizoctonia solani]|uniref:Uncharacterized protein n=1 Tax=Rhizoctonia solani TaxID=456999 RepID=A0A8H7HA93_9AGAM|nr:uncharacterized protein RhiXN_02241 [Rhizoctonia solani]KAF8682141.1 hypothetical protein RHS04_02141 [Rhizoctonia solani]QRW27646.1 hypothetical protein RhiXN_02241 [Rhizoctonia solani]CAE6475510.1 unnamed protein product [Rhizoctonia solani]
MPEFTPIQVVDRSKEKEWPHKLGVMDWDDTRIVFTKRQLIDFLKYVGVTVDTNFAQIAKLPRYAEFGTISGESSNAGAIPVETSAAPVQAESASSNPGDSSWKPTRRVRTVPGGVQSIQLGDGDEPPSWAAPSAKATTAAPTAAPAAPTPASPEPEYRGVVDSDGQPFKPTRRVRTAPGGKDSIGAFLGGE